MVRKYKKSGYGSRVVSAAVCLLFLAVLWGTAACSPKSPAEYYVSGGSVVAISPPLDEKSVLRAADRFAYLYETYLLPKGMNAYVVVIPDKSFYLPDKEGRGQMDYGAMYELVCQAMDYAKPIDITDCLNADSYYATDSHWRQECLLPVADRISGTMLKETASDVSYEMKTAVTRFVGSYADAPEASGLKPDAICYLTNEMLEQTSVYRYDTDTAGGVYDWDKADSRNPYDFFLSGPVALMHLDNPAAATDRQLVVFRDSYAGPLLPLLLPFYREMLVVDIRYTMSDRLSEYVDFSLWEGADALYLYSTALLNRSVTLK